MPEASPPGPHRAPDLGHGGLAGPPCPVARGAHRRARQRLQDRLGLRARRDASGPHRPSGHRSDHRGLPILTRRRSQTVPGRLWRRAVASQASGSQTVLREHYGIGVQADRSLVVKRVDDGYFEGAHPARQPPGIPKQSSLPVPCRRIRPGAPVQAQPSIEGRTWRPSHSSAGYRQPVRPHRGAGRRRTGYSRTATGLPEYSETSQTRSVPHWALDTR